MIPDGAIVGGVISKIINDLTDVSKSKIKKAVEDKKNKHKRLESQLYNLIASLLKEMNDNSYDKNSDKIYDTAEKLLKGFKEYGKEDEDAVRYALKNILPCVDDDKCMEFKRLLIHEISKEEYNELYREIRLLQEEKEYRKTDRIERKVDHLDQKLDDIRKNDERIIRNIDKVIKFQNNKKQDYIDNWNSRLFLHIDNDERPITLADAFIMPYYEYHIKDKRIKLSEKDTMDEVIEKFIKHNRSANMLITGVPGIGKTSIVSWIANEYKERHDIIILRFRDWERDEFYNGLLQAICNTLHCIKRDLENKILILDGFDEIKVLDNGENLIRNFFNEILDFRDIKVIITSRTDYINIYLFQYIFKLLPFQIDKIKQFYYIITGNAANRNIDQSNLDVLGIPVILYMSIMTDIDLTKEATKPELYDRIFAEKGGIFDKFSYGGDGYDYGNQILRDSKNIKSYLGFLQEIAFKMFDEDTLSLPRKEDEIPKLSFQGAEISVLEFPIKHLFDNTVTNIEFVHKSIYEYFVTEYIIQNIKDVLKKDDYKEKIACFFGKTLMHGNITNEMEEFLKYKISDRGLNDVYDKVAETFQLMLKNGMTYYSGVCCKNIIKCEMNVFSNMLEIIHLWDRTYFEVSDTIIDYLYYSKNYKLNLKRIEIEYDYCKSENIKLVKMYTGIICLHKAELSGANLGRISLSRAELEGANLEEVNLEGTNLASANLKRTNLRKAKLKEADLQYADLTGADLREVDLTDAYFGKTKVDNSIWLEDDIQKFTSQLKVADFEYILIWVNTNRKRRIHRVKLFSDENRL